MTFSPLTILKFDKGWQNFICGLWWGRQDEDVHCNIGALWWTLGITLVATTLFG